MKLITFIVLLAISIPAKSQRWRPEFQVPMDARTINTEMSTLNDFLDYGTPLTGSDCQIRVSMFSFRVNYLGVVDSVYSEGTFFPEAIDAITRNIRSTSGHWVVPKGTKKGDSCWFLYPCFMIGAVRESCRDRLDIPQKSALLLHETLSRLAFQFDSGGRCILPANKLLFNSVK